MAQITSHTELEGWLKHKPADWAQVIAARAALRVFPYAFDLTGETEWLEVHILVLIRINAISWASCNFPAKDMSSAARSAVATPYAVTLIHAASYATAAAKHAGMAIGYKSLYSVFSAVDDANMSVFAALSANDDLVGHVRTNRAFWNNLYADCDWLENTSDPTFASRFLTREPLWPAGAPNGWSEAWVSATGRLAALNQGYSVWVDWYDRRVRGNRAAFAIPGDTDRKEDKAILARLADATNEDFWDKGATYVNTTLQGWIDEARERVAVPDEPPPELKHDTIATITAPLVSPDVIARNNQLDVVPNAILDVQSDAFDLAEAIAVLRSLVGTLRPCLTDNISPIFAPSLARYDQELEERAAKPFIGVLARMEEQVEAQFNAEPDAFEAGVGINFKSYFAEHHQFMTHYQNHLEREKVIAELKIDERAASGKALTSAFDTAALKAEELFNQGLATDGYRDEIVAQQQNLKALEYSQDTAGNKRAKLLQIVQSVGFLQQTLIASATIVATVAALPQFITVVEAAIAALSKFFI